MNSKEYIEGAKRTETLDYPAYMALAESNPELIASIVLGLSAYGHAFDKIKKSIIYGKEFTFSTGETLTPGKAEDYLSVFIEDHFEDYIEGASEDFDEGGAIIRDRVKELRIARLIHASLGIITEQAEILQAIFKYITGKQELDMVNLREEVGDTLWYGAIEVDTLGVDLEATATQNLAKLKLRYPDKFTCELALNRDTAAERTLLEAE